MKKGIIVSALAAVAVVGGLAAIITLSPKPPVEAAEEKEPSFELKTGKYYHDGDANKEYYIEVFDDGTITMVNPDLYTVFEEDIKRTAPADADPAEWAEGINENVEVHTARTKYVKKHIEGVENEDWIMLEWNGSSGFGYNYLDENTIGWGELGKFVYVG